MRLRVPPSLRARLAVVAVVAVAGLLAALLVLTWDPGSEEEASPSAGSTTTTGAPSTTGPGGSTTAGPTTAGPTTAAPTTGGATTGPLPTTAPAASTTTLPPSATTAPSSPTTGPAAAAVEIRRGDQNRRVVALTFDAGSDTGFAARILDILAGEGLLASFGITGQWAEDNPGLVRRMAAEGHLLLNHSYDHPSFTGRSTGRSPISSAERLEQLRRTEQVIVEAAGQPARPWFRPPYGDTDPSVLTDVGSAGYRWSAMWTVDSLGWQGISASQIVDRCLSRAEPGAIYLFHVGSASADADALPAIIAGLRGAGYGFDTVAGLIGA